MKFRGRRWFEVLMMGAALCAGCSSDDGEKKGPENEPVVVPEESLVIIEAPDDLTTSEGVFTPVSLYVRLSRKPEGKVVLNVDCSNTNEGLVSPGTIEFDESNWNQATLVSVYGVDDSLLDGPKNYDVTIRVSSTDDEAFNGFSKTLTFTNLDDETEESVISPVRISIPMSHHVDEKGSSVSVDVVLKHKPSSEVRIEATSSDPGECRVEPSSFVFNPDEYNASQVLKIVGVDDDEADGNQLCLIHFDVSSSDSAFDKAAVKDLEIVNRDDETKPGVRVSGNKLVTGEDGTVDVFSIELDNKPAYPVYIYLSTSNPGEVSLKPSVLRLTPENDGIAEVVVYGKDDDKVDGDQEYEITIKNISSNDDSYSGIEAWNETKNEKFTSLPGVNVDNDGDDSQNEIIIEAVDNGSKKRTPKILGMTSEDGDKATYTVKLKNPPKDGHQIIAVPVITDPTEGSVSPNIFYFNENNWSEKQAFTITGLDDDEADGDITYGMYMITVSTDYSSDELQSNYVILVNKDNENEPVVMDKSLVIEKQHNVLYINEDGQARSFTVALNSQPSDDVVVKCVSKDTTEGKVVAGDKMTFTQLDWMTPQTVMVQGVDDTEADGNVSFFVECSASGYASASVEYLNHDNDSSKTGTETVIDDNTSSAGAQKYVSTTPNTCGATANISENQPYHLYIHLNRQPSNSIKYVFNLSSTDAASLAENKDQAQKTLTFKPENYNIDQILTVYGKSVSSLAETALKVSVQAVDSTADAEFLTDENKLCGITVKSHPGEIQFAQKQTQRLRIMTANTTSGSSQLYEDPGMHFFYAMDADIMLVQEFRNSSEAVMDGLVETLKHEYYYYVGEGRIGNGIISKYPILWTESRASNLGEMDRRWDAALIDIPGDKDMLVLSLHLHTKKHSKEFPELADWINSLMKKGDYYLAVGGDFNAGVYNTMDYSRDVYYCSAVSALNELLTTSFAYPRDQYGNVGTSSSRNKQLDWLLVDPQMHAYSTPVQIGNRSYPYGYVLDSRVQDPISDIAPVVKSDSDAAQMQHMPVIRDFLYEY